LADERARWWLIGAMGGLLGLLLLDETVVGVALGQIRADLGLSEVGAAWVVSAYLLVFTSLVAAGGKLGDVVGLRRWLLGGIVVFGAGAAAAGLAERGGWIIAARCVQGAGAAVVFPSTLAVIARAFAPGRRGVAIGVYGAIGTTFLGVGPFVGGVLTDALSWRWYFWLSPMMAGVIGVVIVLSWRGAMSERVRDEARIDWIGLALLASGLGMVVLGVMQGPEWGWGSAPILVLLAGGAAGIAALVARERGRRDALLDVRLLSRPTVRACNLVVLTAQWAKMVMVVFGAQYLQRERGMDALGAGVALLAVVAPSPFASWLGGWCADRFGSRPTALVALAALGASMAVIGLGLEGGAWVLIASGVVAGTGVSVAFSAAIRASMNAAPGAAQGQASGVLLTSQLLGATIGIASGSTLLAMTGSHAVVMLAGAGVVLGVLAAAWAWLEREPA
jgi:MFS family permease